MKRAIVIPDQHFPVHDEKAVKVVLEAIDLTNAAKKAGELTGNYKGPGQ